MRILEWYSLTFLSFILISSLVDNESSCGKKFFNAVVYAPMVVYFLRILEIVK